MKRKTPHPITSESNNTKKLKWDDDYFCLYDFKRKPVSQAFIEAIAKEYIQWSLRETSMEFEADFRKREALRIGDFLAMKGISRQTWSNWVNKYPLLKEADDFVRERIASLREYGALKDKYKEKTIHLTQGHYDWIFREEQERLSQLNKLSVQESVVYTTKEIAVEMPDFGSSPLVKEKKETHE